MASSLPKIPLPLPVQGIRSDLNDFSVPPDALRSTSYNWLLRNGHLRTRPGLTTFGQDTGGFVPTGIISFFNNFGTNHVVYATSQKWWRYDAATGLWADISDPTLLLSGSSNIPVNFRVFNTGGNAYLLGVNGVNTPRAWDSTPTTNLFTEFGGSPPTARCIAIIGDRVALGHLVTGPSDPSGIDLSAFQDHTSGWGVTQTATLVDTEGYIVQMLEMGGLRTAIYKTDSIYLASATTGLAPIRFDIQVTNVPGPINSTSVVALNSLVHAVFTREANLYLFDGINYNRHPSSDQMRALYEQDASPDSGARLKTHGYYDKRYNELWWFYTAVGFEAIGPKHAIVIHLDNGSTWKVDFTNNAFAITSAHYGSVFYGAVGKTRELTVLGDSLAQTYLFEGDDDAGTPISAFMETGLNDLGDPTLFKSLEETEHYFTNPDSTQTPSVTILSSNSGEDPTVSDSQTLSLTTTSTGPYVTGHRSSSGERITTRRVGMRINDAGLTAPIEYVGSSITMAPRGTR